MKLPLKQLPAPCVLIHSATTQIIQGYRRGLAGPIPMPAVTAGYEGNVTNVVPMSGRGFSLGHSPGGFQPASMCDVFWSVFLLIRGVFSLVNSSNTTFLGNFPKLSTSSGYLANSTGPVCNWLSVLPVHCVVCYCEQIFLNA